MGANPKQRATDHVVQQGRELLCLHCGSRLNPFQPDPHGPALRGLPIAMLAGTMKQFAKDHQDCDPAGGAAVEERRERERAEAARDPMTWILGPDTGISSVTIWHVMTGQLWPGCYQSFGPDVPPDPSDFGRCHRLLQVFPAWRARLSEVARRYPVWGPMVREWDRMTALYEQESQRPDGMAPELYKLMKQLEDEGYALARAARKGE